MPTPLLDQHLRFPDSVEHLRAFNRDLDRYEDVLFPRMLKRVSARASGDLPADTDWGRVNRCACLDRLGSKKGTGFPQCP